jgi:hypothetical protein
VKYAILIYDENTANPVPEPDSAMMGKIMAEYNAFSEAINAAGVNLGVRHSSCSPPTRW